MVGQFGFLVSCVFMVRMGCAWWFSGGLGYFVLL